MYGCFVQPLKVRNDTTSEQNITSTIVIFHTSILVVVSSGQSVILRLLTQRKQKGSFG